MNNSSQGSSGADVFLGYVNCTKISDINFDLPERYEPIKLIGKGTYGAVVSATDKMTGEKVAIKKLSKIEDLVNLSNIN